MLILVKVISLSYHFDPYRHWLMRSFSLRLSDLQHKEVKAIAARDEVSMNDVIREALRLYLAQGGVTKE
jgi:predicted HicB family RNase H-like nuclease